MCQHYTSIRTRLCRFCIICRIRSCGPPILWYEWATARLLAPSDGWGTARRVEFAFVGRTRGILDSMAFVGRIERESRQFVGQEGRHRRLDFVIAVLRARTGRPCSCVHGRERIRPRRHYRPRPPDTATWTRPRTNTDSSSVCDLVLPYPVDESAYVRMWIRRPCAT